MGMKGWVWGGGGLVLLIGGVGLAYANSNLGRADNSLEREIEAARKLGMPLSPQELASQVAKRTSGTNAADSYLNAYKLIPKSSLDYKAVKKLVLGTATPAEVAKLRTELGGLKPALMLFERGTEMDTLNYRRDWKQGLSLLLLDLASHRRLENALVVRGILAMQDGKRQEAEDSLIAAARASRHLEFDPILISMYVRATEETTVSRALARYLSRYDDPRGLAFGKRLVSELGPVPDFRNIVGSELMMGTVSISEIVKSGRQLFGTSPDQASDLAWNTLQLTPVRRANHASLIEHWRLFYEDLPVDPTNCAAIRQAVKSADERAGSSTDLSRLLVQLMAPLLSEAGNAQMSFVARRTTWGHAFHAVETKQAQKKLPATLDAKDPFLNPYVYKVNPTGFTLTSLGPNHKSDEGANEDIGNVDDTSITLDFSRK